ncbi:MAG: acyloxyacyl hydrolase [Myxococcales bacterium]|jgi:hypothetical protein
MRSLGYFAGWLAAVLWAAPAGAQDERPEEPAPSSFEVRLRGGLGGYTGSYAPLTSVGPAWGLSIGFKTASWAGLELAYEGSQNNLQGRGGALVRNGGFLLGRVFCDRGELFPYLAAGVGVTYVDPTQGAGASAIGDTVIEVPFALGLDWRRGVLSVGVRAAFNLLLGERFLQPLSPDGEAGFASGSLLLGLGF